MSATGSSGSGGNAKYVIIGLLLLGGAAGLWLMLKPATPSPAPAPQAKPAEVARVNPLADQPLVIEDEPTVPDAGAPAVDAGDVKKPSGAKHAKRDEWDCAGDVARAGLQSVIDQNRAQVRNCYERRLKANNVLQGDLKLKLRIAQSGKVSTTAISGSLRDEEVYGCVRSIASKWSFPPPDGGDCAVIQVPFQFSPKN